MAGGLLARIMIESLKRSFTCAYSETGPRSQRTCNDHQYGGRVLIAVAGPEDLYDAKLYGAVAGLLWKVRCTGESCAVGVLYARVVVLPLRH